MSNTEFIENLMVLHHFTKKLFKYSCIKNFDSNLNETHAKILLVLYKHKISQMNKINSFIGIQKGAFTTSVDILINNGYLLKSKDEKDKRISHLQLTDKGYEMATKLEDNLYKSIDDMFSTTEEKEKITDSLKTISNFCKTNFTLEKGGHNGR